MLSWNDNFENPELLSSHFMKETGYYEVVKDYFESELI